METPQETEARTNTYQLRKQDSKENTSLSQIKQRQSNNQARYKSGFRRQRTNSERMTLEVDVADFHEKERNPSLMLHYCGNIFNRTSPDCKAFLWSAEKTSLYCGKGKIRNDKVPHTQNLQELIAKEMKVKDTTRHDMNSERKQLELSSIIDIIDNMKLTESVVNVIGNAIKCGEAYVVNKPFCKFRNFPHVIKVRIHLLTNPI
ncbi:Hypothetical predicted protein [Octopus vulgaris]|uniref:Uncharacterized protein n=1 Tax=Octopus vulgaris TaxID=6645 RepID=A0AA36API2_OCTVU|nr:Hypothetical predicted protein [Octopus vulgaris]